MKRFLTIVFFIVSLSGLSAQDFEIIADGEGIYTGVIGSEIRVPVKIKNISDRPIYIFVERIATKIGSTQTTNFCWGDECFESTIEKLPISKRIEPGQITDAFVSVLNTGLVSGFSTIDYSIYTRNNASDKYKLQLTYIIEDQKAIPMLYTSNDIKLNEVYPNPVKDFAVVDYQITNPDVKAKIVLHNVLGSMVGEFELPVFEKQLKISAEEYNPGVYFYTLYLDGDGIVTKKLVIRR